MLYLQTETIQVELTGRSLSTISTNIDEWRATTEWDSTHAGSPHPEPSWFCYSRWIWLAIGKLSINDLLTDNVQGVLSPEDTPNQEPIDPQQPDVTCTLDPTKRKAHRQVVGVETARMTAHGAAIGLYNLHRRNSTRWNPWHLFQSAYHFQQIQSFSQQITIWIDQHLMHGLDSFNIQSFQLANAMQNVVSELDFELSYDSWFEDYSHIFRTLYYRHWFKCIQFQLAHLLFQVQLNFELVHLAASGGHRIYSKMNTTGCWWETQDQLPALAMMVPVVWASKKTHLTDVSGNQHALQLYLTIDTNKEDICRTPKRWIWIRFSLIQCPPQGANNIDEVWHCAVETELCQLMHHDITGTGLKWDCAYGFQWQCYPLMAGWGGEYPEQVIVAQVSYGSCWMCEIYKGVPNGHSTFRLLDNACDQHIYLELLENNNDNTLHALGVHPICNQFWQYSRSNVYWLCQPDELHHLLLHLVKGLLNQLLEYLKEGQVKDQFDNWFALGPRYPSLQYISKPFDLLMYRT